MSNTRVIAILLVALICGVLLMLTGCGGGDLDDHTDDPPKKAAS